MDKPIFDIDVPGMQVAVNSYKPGNGLAWPQLFPLKYTPKFDIKGLEGDEGIPVTADRVAFNTRSPKKSRKTIDSWSGKLGKYSVSRDKDELEINEYRDLQTLSAANAEDPATAKYLVDLVYNDIDFVNNAMDYKVELDSMRIGSSGVQDFDATYDGDMAQADTINFNVPSDNFGGVPTTWDTTDTADALKDIADWQRKITKKGRRKPMYAFLERTAFDDICNQKAVAKRLFPLADQTLVSSDMISLDAINAYMLGKGWPQLVVLDTYVTVEKKDGTRETIKPWSENVVVLSPVAQLGWTYYKPVPLVENTDALQVQGPYYKVTRYSEVNPMAETTMAEAYVQPGLINRASLVFINIKKTTWNNGAA